MRREVPELAGVWQGLATGLGLSPAHVREIDLANRGDPSRCLDGVIEKWLNQDYNYNKFGEPSWKKLVAAVADSSGGKNTALARKIGQKHPHRECHDLLLGAVLVMHTHVIRHILAVECSRADIMHVHVHVHAYD